MSKHESDILHGVIIESSTPLTLAELAHALRLQHDIIQQMVEHHLFEPRGQTPSEWLFDDICLKRARTAANLHRDLEINFPGISLALDLLEKIDALEQQLQKNLK